MATQVHTLAALCLSVIWVLRQTIPEIQISKPLGWVTFYDSSPTLAVPCLSVIWVLRQIIPEIQISKQRAPSWVTYYDSGGALVAQDNDLQGWSAVGLVSYQPGNILEWPECGSDKFTVFTEVSK